MLADEATRELSSATYTGPPTSSRSPFLASCSVTVSTSTGRSAMLRSRTAAYTFWLRGS